MKTKLLTEPELETFLREVHETFNRLPPCSHFEAYLAGYNGGLGKWQESLAKDREAMGRVNLWGDEEVSDA